MQLEFKVGSIDIRNGSLQLITTVSRRTRQRCGTKQKILRMMQMGRLTSTGEPCQAFGDDIDCQ
jgi:hypothetical protein